jgi:hypothetical protein
MYRLVAREARRIEAARRPVTAAALPGLARKVLGARIPGGTPHHRRLFHTAAQRKATGQNVYRFIVESEPGIQCVLRRVCRGGMPYRLDPGEEARLYLPNVSSQADLAEGATMRGVKDFWMMDVRGLGEGLIDERDPWQGYGHEYMMDAHALMYGESLLADRVFDVLSAVRLLRAEGARRVHLIGRGQGAILAMLAGLLDREIATVRSLGAPDSIRAMVCEPLNDWPDANFPQGILRHFDLPDVRRALGKRLTADTRGDPGRFGA